MAEDRKHYSSNSKFEKLYGYSRAVAVGNLVYVAGTTGYDYDTHEISDDPAEQTRQTFRNIETALEAVGATFADVVKIVTYFTDRDDWDAIGGVLHDQLQGVHPVNAAILTGLIDPRMKVEISAVAVRREGG